MLYERYYAYGIGICYRYAYTREDAVEILNDGFMNVFDNLHRYNSDRPFKPWFRKILVNKAIDYCRKNKRHQQTENLEDEHTEVYHTEQVHQMDRDNLMNLLNGLPEAQRLVFNLYEIEGYAHDEIGEMLNMNTNTSRSYLARAKQRLRMKYKELYPDDYEQII